MVFVRSKCIICDVNFVSRLSVMDDSKNSGLPLLWSKIFATFCNYFHLDPSTWDDILNFYLEVNDIPFCTHCRNTMALLVILEDKIQSIKTKYNDADNHNSNNKNTREILMERSKLKVEYKISKIIAAISYTILKNNDNNEDNYNDQPQSEESEEEVIYDPDIIHRISMLRKTIYKHFNPSVVLSDCRRCQMRKRIKKNRQPAQVLVSSQPAPESSPIVTVMKEEELSIMDVDVMIESVDFNYDEFEDKILEEEEAAAVKLRLKDGEEKINFKFEMDEEDDNFDHADDHDPLYIPPSEFESQSQHTGSSLWTLHQRKRREGKQNLTNKTIPILTEHIWRFDGVTQDLCESSSIDHPLTVPIVNTRDEWTQPFCQQKEGCAKDAQNKDWRQWARRDRRDHTKLLYGVTWPVNVTRVRKSSELTFSCRTCGQERQSQSEMAIHIQENHIRDNIATLPQSPASKILRKRKMVVPHPLKNRHEDCVIQVIVLDENARQLDQEEEKTALQEEEEEQKNQVKVTTIDQLKGIEIVQIIDC